MAKRRAGNRRAQAVGSKRQVGRTAKPRTAPARAVKTRAAAKRTRSGAVAKRAAATRARTSERTRLFAPIAGSEPRVVGGVQMDVVRAGTARVKRLVYPVGFHWDRDMKPVTGTEFCMHAHVGFLAHGEIHIEYADGCLVELRAPQVVVIEPGHDGWVVGSEPAVLIEVDFERDTIGRLGIAASHRHD